MIAIVDYGLGNLKAFSNVYKNLNTDCILACNPADLENATKIILPGVGAFDEAIHRLENSGMRKTLDELVLNRKIPALGVCVGMQILGKNSEEGQLAGLGWIDGKVKKFCNKTNSRLILPHMGWNNIMPVNNNRLFEGIEPSSKFYFLHSYYFECKKKENVLAVTDYGGEFACAVNSANIYGVQFHPEKSHRFGIRLLANFAKV